MPQKMDAAAIKVAEFHRNRMAIWLYFRNNPCSQKAECARVLGLSSKTVSSHCKAISEGWRPHGWVPDHTSVERANHG